MEGEAAVRMWAAVMTGDAVRDGQGRPWNVGRVAHEGEVVWVELFNKSSSRTLRVPSWTDRVELTEGPGWGVSAHSPDAMGWGVGLVGATLGGLEI